MAPFKKKKDEPVKQAAVKKAVIKTQAAPKIVTKDQPVAKTIEVVPKVLTGEGWRRKRIAALKNKK